MFRSSRLITFVAAFFSFVSAQFPPTPEGITVVDVECHPGVSISYKQTSICETQARAFAGYVHMPSSYLRDAQPNGPYNVSMFFWYFEARNNPRNAPTTIYLAGGPGESSMYGAVLDGGPCNVLPDGNSTAHNPWSMNENVNMLYVDQPVGAGFSYDVLIKSTLDLLFLGDPTQTGITPFDAYNGSVPAQNSTFLHGVLPSQDPSHTTSSSALAARTLWHFSQLWFAHFPEYRTRNRRVGYWGNSYGGYWVPAAAAYTIAQNARIQGGKLAGEDALVLPVDTIGFTNGCVDISHQMAGYPQMAYNNTYGTAVIPREVYASAQRNVSVAGGCLDQIAQCRALGARDDPQHLGLNASVNAACLQAFEWCEENVVGAFDALSNRSDYDIAAFKPASTPPNTPIAFFNRAWVQRELGVPVNFTSDSLLVNNVMLFGTADAVRTAGLQSLEYLLEQGVKVALVYGDRDYRCPWTGAEQLSLDAKWSGAQDFRKAGYEEIRTSKSYDGGVVRQYGNLSFSRVFQSGHDVAWYQPETAFQIFNRAVFSKDVATGTVSTAGVHSNYTSHGPSSSYGWRQKLPPPPPNGCYLLDVASTCTIEQYEALIEGTAVVKNFYVVKPAGGSPGSIQGVF